MKQSLGQWLSVVCLCLTLLGFPIVFGACSSIMDTSNQVTYAPNGSVQFPYPLEAIKGKCAAWSVVLDPGGGAPLCAASLPTQQVGMYVQMSVDGFSQSMCITSIDTRHKVVHLK